jgi:hypothetical protein
MSSAEILRIVIPMLGIFIIATILIIFVRGRSAKRELALTELAARDGLKYTPGGKDFFQGSWPGKVAGIYRARKLTFQYTNRPFMSRQGFMAADYWAVIEIAVKNPGGGSLSLENLKLTSKPETFAKSVLGNSQLQQRLDQTRGRVNVVNSGMVAFTSNRMYRDSAELIGLVDVLSDLADVVEAQPVRTSAPGK